MTVCKHCGTEIEDGLEYCPNCGQSIDENFGDFFDADGDLEEEAYNIFDMPEEFDMDSLLDREFSQGTTFGATESASFLAPADDVSEDISLYDSFSEPEDIPEPDIFPTFEEINEAEELYQEPEPQIQTVAEEQDDLAELLGLFAPGQEDEVASEPIAEINKEPELESVDGLDFPVAEETDFFALDELFQDIEPEPMELGSTEPETVDQGLEELLAAGNEDSADKNKKEKKKKEKKSFFQAIFGNVPVDPSKVKPEPTPEELQAKKQKQTEEKKAKAEEKKLAAEEKKQIAQQNKADKARQKALAKEEKKAKKLQEAKLILEEMQETRINRVGATIVFVFFAICAVVLLSGSKIFGYAISINSAEKNFNKAYDNNVKYYTDAYNDIYGLEIKPEDQILSDKIMTVMFVNKELNSYNSYMVMEDYQAALHSLLLGLYRYGKYYEKAIPLGIDRDMDYVRTQILKELDATFHVSEDEAEVLRSMLEDAGAGGMNIIVDAGAARRYNLALYEIVEESGLNDDSDN